MKFFKLSIVFIFLLSLLSAASALYLSIARENEKAKRVYLEGVKADLEKQVQSLESKKAELDKKVTDLELKNKDLARQLDEQKQNYQRSLDQIRDKDLDLESLRREAEEAKKAFDIAQKRNEELEKIFDQLEGRLRQSEQKISTSSETGFVEISVEPAANSVSPIESSETARLETQTATKTEAIKKEMVQRPAAVAPSKLAKPKRRFFSFLHSRKKKSAPENQKPVKPKSELVSTASLTEEKTSKVIPKKMEAPKQVESKIEEVESEVKEEISELEPPTKSGVKTPNEPEPPAKAVTFNKTAQTIASGSVLLVNRTYNFIVLNLGSKHGLGMDEVLSVRRNGTEIGKARVEKLYDDYSAAYIIEEKSDQPIGEGDAVTAA